MIASLIKKILAWGFVLLVLIGLFFKTQTFNVDRYYQALDDLRKLQQIDLTINASILKSRFGLSANYDSLVADWASFYSSLTQTQKDLQNAIQQRNPGITQQFTELQKIIDKKENEVEQFKSKLSVLQNSLRYFPIVTNGLIQDLDAIQRLDRILSQKLESLLQQILIYSLNGREDLRPSIITSLNRLSVSSQGLTGELNDRLANITKHAETIIRVQTEISLLVQESLNQPSGSAIDQLIVDYEIYHKQILQDSNNYRLILYALMIGLFVYVVILFQARQKSHYLKLSNERLEYQVRDRTQALETTLQDFQQSQAQLIQAEKMSGLGQLVAGIAHEVNNPINFIYGNIKPAQQYTNDLFELLNLYTIHYPQPHPEIQEMIEEIDLGFMSQDLKKLLTSMKFGADRIRDLVLSLRNFSRLDEADRKQANLHEGIDSTILILQHRLKSKGNYEEIQLIYDYGELPIVNCYPGQINQVLMNILANGIDALEEACEKDNRFIPTIQIRTQSIEENRVQIQIIDNGPGIPKAVLDRIFDPFYTTKPIGQGTGLGLSISYQIIVEKHGGTLECFSEPGQGTEFRIRLPL